MSKSNLISCSFYFNSQGIEHGFLKLPHSDNQSAWGNIMTPICMIHNRQGPTVLITGANHGAEYEAQWPCLI